MSKIQSDQIVTDETFTYNALELADGTVGSPALRFTSDIDTGIRLVAVGNLGITVAGADRAQFSSGGMVLNTGQFFPPNGSAAAPSYAFNSDTDTGIYRSAANNLSIAANGTQVAIFAPSSCNFFAGVTDVLQIVSTGTRHFIDGSAAAPSIHWSADTDTGIFRSASNQFNLVTNGVSRFVIGTASVEPSVLFQPATDNAIGNGSASFRWSDLRSVLINGADYGFANGYVMREYPCTADDVQTKSADWMKENANKGIQILNDLGDQVCVIGRDGTVYAKAFKPLSELPV